MLTHPTLEKLTDLRLHGMAAAFDEQSQNNSYADLTFEERLGLMADREMLEKQNRLLKTRLNQAKLRFRNACMADINYKQKRGLDKSLVKSLGTCEWIRDKLNVIITGPTGIGKGYIACALGHSACMEGMKVLYSRSSRLIEDLSLAKGDGRYLKILNKLSKMDVLIIDDWGLSELDTQASQDFLEIFEDRYDNRSTIITSQIPIDNWHETIKNPTLADAILDRIVHNAYKIEMDGPSMRREKHYDLLKKRKG